MTTLLESLLNVYIHTVIIQKNIDNTDEIKFFSTTI